MRRYKRTKPKKNPKKENNFCDESKLLTEAFIFHQFSTFLLMCTVSDFQYFFFILVYSDFLWSLTHVNIFKIKQLLCLLAEPLLLDLKYIGQSGFVLTGCTNFIKTINSWGNNTQIHYKSLLM